VYKVKEINKIIDQILNQNLEENKSEEEAKPDEEAAKNKEEKVRKMFINNYVIFKERTQEDTSPPPQTITFGFHDNKLDIDILFYILYRATNNVIYEIMKNPK
jgi:Zn-dependent M32 family carboxypeptidase